MSAVVDSISEAVLPPPSTPSAENKSKGKADISSPAGGKNDSTSPAATLVDTTSSSILTRVDTPHPHRSNSGNNRRVSISAASPVIATFTPERSRQLYHYEEQDPHELSDSDDSMDGNQPLLSPHQPINPDNTFESNATSGSDVNMTTLSSSAADVSFGPQEVPFPLRQRGIQVDAHSTPSRPSVQAYTSEPRDPTAPPVVIRPVTTEKVRTTTRTTTTATSVVSSGDDYDPKLLSSWRQEQIKTTRTAKLMAGTTPRPIPTLHGPLSLPYARNPSGVDATVADESAYLSHVFGLRAAGGMTVNNLGGKTARHVSSGTNSSGTTTSRSASGSSGIGNTTGSSQERSTLTEGSSYTTAGGTHYSRPVVIRDPYQNIGIKIKGVPPKEGSAALAKKDVVMDEYEDKENLDPSISGRLRRRASETSLLEPRMGEAVIGPSRSQVNLRDMTNLSPIPGSPADNAFRDPFRVLYERALTTDGANPSANRDTSHSGSVKLPTLVPIYFNPTSMTYEVAVPNRSSYEDLHINTPRGPVTPQTLKTAHQASKADSSDNWRKKGGDTEESQANRNDLAVPTNSPAAPQEANSDPKIPTAEGSVMTIDSLFEKFHTSEEQSEPHKGPASKSSVRGDSGKQPGLKSSKSSPVSPKGTSINVLGENTKKLNANAAPYSPTKSEKNSSSTKKRPSSPITTKGMPTPSKANSSSAKGTPGAGKLLKKAGSSEGEETASPTTSVPSKGKGKAKAGKK